MKAILNKQQQHEILSLLGRAADEISEVKQKLEYYQHRLTKTENSLRRTQYQLGEQWPTQGDDPDDEDIDLSALGCDLPDVFGAAARAASDEEVYEEANRG